LDAFDRLYLWLPAFYLNFTSGSEFLLARKKEGEARSALYPNRQAAVTAYLKTMLPDQA
jgi:hypothetical protein